ncbi:putative small auxin-up RNA [Helianthus annuus]|uniref:Putative SAUR-like auxin-responsive protein family n=1 Tax=Helianthus annuus TaxID=4232 RepID=A0A251STB3_HELAN|nr:putative small auxin-up RNA [Helianthus annuus]KAJ0477441.1 putative small auxin-up RNA [Helianthus annuus]KAJ0481903.1 putative small auxin-up RNA [Helianthus annuus]KAJ0498276.1 putative small auxin-up RNA [Helianthus annuus]KAJ0664279.1 putative small auxin-up RNA [Helianthus annuus]
MKKLISRLSRVADSSHYSLLRSDSRFSHRSRTPKSRRSGGVPEGHLPVYVGDEMERFIVSADLLNHPIFINLLNKSAQEYGYEQKGVLRIPCHVLVFERVLEAMRLGEEASYEQLQILLGDEFICDGWQIGFFMWSVHTDFHV